MLFTIRELRAYTLGTGIAYILFISLEDGSVERWFGREKGKRRLRGRAVV